jgi:hypothetical protein
VGVTVGGLVRITVVLVVYGGLLFVAGGAPVYLISRRRQPPDPRLIVNPATVTALQTLRNNHAKEYGEQLAGETAGTNQTPSSDTGGASPVRGKAAPESF